jgi:hypothetical protein
LVALAVRAGCIRRFGARAALGARREELEAEHCGVLPRPPRAFYLAADAAQLRAVQRELVALMDRPALARRERRAVPVAGECFVAALLALAGALIGAAVLRIDLA